jgi:elongation factor G
MGDISGDLASRRGRISDTQSIDGGRIKITAQAPLAELSDYSSRLKSLTGAEGEFLMTPFAYEQVPPEIQQQLIKEHKAN